MEARSKVMPVHIVKYGKVHACIWRNETKHGARFNVTASRIYLENEEWKRSDSLGRDELLVAAKALTSAYDWIWAQSGDSDAERDRGAE